MKNHSLHPWGCVFFPLQCFPSPVAALFSTLYFFIFVPLGLIIGLLSSSALVFALSDILGVPADLLRLLSVPDIDINSCYCCIADSLLIVTEKMSFIVEILD